MRLAALLAALLLPRPAPAADSQDFDGARKEPPKTFARILKERGALSPEIGGAAGIDERFWVVVAASGAAERTRASKAGLSIEEVGSGTVAGVADYATISRLEAAGFKIVERLSLRGLRPEDFPPGDSIYHNYGETEAELKRIAAAHPGLIEVFSIGKSVEGRSLSALRFHKKGAGGLPGIAFFGTHHAREHLSTEVPLLLAGWLADNRDREDVKRLLETRDVYLLPLVNPDGVEYDIATENYRWQRKNMSRNADGSLGVDLNRNYDWRWGGEGSSGYPGSDTYHGPAAFSEPESKAVRDFLKSRENIRIVVSYHTFSELVLYPWGGDSAPIDDARALAAFKAMAETMGAMTGYRPMQSADLYVATGDTCDWAWGELKMFCFTFELTPKSSRQGGFYPGADAVSSTFKKNIAPALYLIELADDPYRAGESS